MKAAKRKRTVATATMDAPSPLVETIDVKTPLRFDVIAWHDAAGGPVNVEDHCYTGLTLEGLRELVNGTVAK